MTHPRWATEDEAAQHIRVSVFTIRRWRDQGAITGHKVGRLVRFDLNELDAMVAGAQETLDVGGV